MAKVELLKVFVASPGDVAEERRIVREVLDSINKMLGLEKNIILEFVGWETDTYPELGSDPQEIVNRQIGDMSQYDIFIGIMWNRFGTPTPRAGSGTEEEFNRALESLQLKGAPATIMYYFNLAPFSPSSEEEAEQKVRVMRFKKKVEGLGMIAAYEGAEDFRAKIHRDLAKLIVGMAITPPHLESKKDETRSEAPQDAPAEDVISDSGMWLLLGTGFLMAEEVSVTGNGKVRIKIAPNNTEEDAFLKSLHPSAIGNSKPVPFAHQNTGAFARVVEAKRYSTADKSYWELVLDIEEQGIDIFKDPAFGDISRDRIAELRARLLLLNELHLPTKPSGKSDVDDANSAMLTALIHGIGSGIKANKSYLPGLWADFKSDPSRFLRIARLWSVFHLITSNTCELILDMTLGPIRSEKLHVKFKGRRARLFSNVEPYVIELEGDCDLTNSHQ